MALTVQKGDALCGIPEFLRKPGWKKREKSHGSGNGCKK